MVLVDPVVFHGGHHREVVARALTGDLLGVLLHHILAILCIGDYAADGQTGILHVIEIFHGHGSHACVVGPLITGQTVPQSAADGVADTVGNG